MSNWEKISKNKYCINVDNKIFTLTLQNIGTYSSGQCWTLRGSLLIDNEVLASYWIRDDGYKTYQKESEENKLWLESEILVNSIKTINKLIKVLNNDSKRS